MHFHYGAVPEDKDFIPTAEAGWHDIQHDLGPLALQLIAFPVTLILIALWAVCVLPRLQGTFSSMLVKIDLGALALLLLMIPVHELLHALVHPGWGLSSGTTLGVWLSRGLLYAYYEGELSRDRFLLCLAMPFLALGVLPTVLIMMFPWLAPNLLGLSLFGCVLGCGDVVGVGLVLFQIPRAAIVRNKGWKTYWRPVS